MLRKFVSRAVALISYELGLVEKVVKRLENNIQLVSFDQPQPALHLRDRLLLKEVRYYCGRYAKRPNVQLILQVNSKKKIAVNIDPYDFTALGYLLNVNHFFPFYLFQNDYDLLLDVGANHGIFSLVGSVFVDNVLSFEPQSEYSNLIVEACELNKISNIRCMNLALGAEEGVTTLYRSKLNSGGASLKRINAENQKDAIAVDINCGSEFLKLFPQAKNVLVKIDVEGSEVEVIRGFGETLNQLTGTTIDWFVEVSSNPETLREILNLLPGTTTIFCDQAGDFVGSESYRGLPGHDVVIRSAF